jgi:predicted metal-dependent HD superfamily phosphohydrolase
VSDLRRAWGAAAPPGTEAERDRLLAAWGEPHRRYHDLGHLAFVVEGVERLGTDLTPAALRVARLAAWWHDAVYRPGPDDERESADWARRTIGVGWDDPVLADEVAAAVLVTAGHDPFTPAQAVLVDADLAVLAGDAAAYERYRSAVRAEYAHVDDAAWREGRSRVLDALLSKDRLFHTPTMRDDAEERARENLGRELSGLR